MNKWRLTEYMRKAGYDQRTLAQRLGMSRNSLNSRINGRTYFDTEEIKAICQAVHLTDPAEILEVFLT